jgi:RHS repeat-associated protein
MVAPNLRFLANGRRPGALTRVLVAFLSAAGLMAGATMTTPVTFVFSCSGLYALSGTQGSLQISCNGGALSPYGTGALSVTSTSTYTEPGGTPTFNNIQGTFSFSPASGGTFLAKWSAASASGPDSNGGFRVSGPAPVISGTGAFQGVTGSLTVVMSGVPAYSGSAQVTITGSGQITTNTAVAGPPVPLGPGPAGNPAGANATSCGDPVTVSNGNMYRQFEDIRLAGRGFPIVVQRTYNSQAASADSPFGFGWTHNYLRYLIDRGGTAIYVGESGAAYTFSLSGGAYTSTSGLDATLAADATGYTLTARGGLITRFDASGRMTKLSDANGNAQTLQYDAQDRLQTIADALGGQVTLTYDDANHIIQVADQSGRKAAFDYDSSGNLMDSTDLAGYETIYTYNTATGLNHQMQRITFPGGGSNAFEYGSDGRLTKTTDQGGGVMRLTYASGATTITGPRGYATTYSFNAAGNVTAEVRSDGTSTSQTWSGGSRLLSRLDEANQTTQFGYDATGRLTSKTDALGNVTGFTYDSASGKTASFTDPSGGAVKNAYDPSGNLTQTVDPLRGTTAYVYNSYGQPLTVTDAAGRTTSYAYDAQGNTKTVGDAVGIRTTSRYDAIHRLVGQTGPTGVEKTFQYDAMGRVTQNTDPTLGTTALSYDGLGNVISVAGPGSASASFQYDALSNLTQVTDALGGLTKYDFQAPECNCAVGGLVSALHDARGQVTKFTYDSKGRLASATDPLGNARRYAWNSRGDMASYTDENGATTHYDYDALRRLVRERYPDGSDQKYAWDAAGRLLSASNANATVTFTYDAGGRVTGTMDSRPRYTASSGFEAVESRIAGRTNSGNRYTVSYGYDAAGKRTSMTAPGGSVTRYVYDAAGRIAKIVAPGGQTFGFNYGGDRNRSSLALPNGLTATYAYDGASRLTGMKYLNGSGTVAAQFAVTYDADGNRSMVTDSVGTNKFQYDKLGRLTDATHPSSAEEIFSYDQSGNRTGAASAAYDAANRLVSYAGVRFTYDNNGNVVSRVDSSGTTTYAYDYSNRLKHVTMPDGTPVVYLYDAFGRRIEKTVGAASTIYVYDSNRLLLEQDQSGVRPPMQYMYRPGSDEALAVAVGGNSYYYLSDSAGNVAGLADASGSMAQTYTYTAFGQAAASPEVVPNSLRFNGREFDAETGLYHMGARAYDPATGRFLQKDPLSVDALLAQLIGGTTTSAAAGRSLGTMLGNPAALHPYVYATNNPLRFADSAGLSEVDLPSPATNPDSLPQDSSSQNPSASDEAVQMSQLTAAASQIAEGNFMAAMQELITGVGGILDGAGSDAGAASGSCSAGAGTNGQEASQTQAQDVVTQADIQVLLTSGNPADVAKAQQVLDNQVQSLEMQSNISKAQSDTLMQVIRMMSGQ